MRNDIDVIPRKYDAVFVVSVEQWQIIVRGIRRNMFSHLGLGLDRC